MEIMEYINAGQSLNDSYGLSYLLTTKASSALKEDGQNGITAAASTTSTSTTTNQDENSTFDTLAQAVKKDALLSVPPPEQKLDSSLTDWSQLLQQHQLQQQFQNQNIPPQPQYTTAAIPYIYQPQQAMFSTGANGGGIIGQQQNILGLDQQQQIQQHFASQTAAALLNLDQTLQSTHAPPPVSHEQAHNFQQHFQNQQQHQSHITHHHPHQHQQQLSNNPHMLPFDSTSAAFLSSVPPASINPSVALSDNPLLVNSNLNSGPGPSGYENSPSNPLSHSIDSLNGNMTASEYGYDDCRKRTPSIGSSAESTVTVNQSHNNENGSNKPTRRGRNADPSYVFIPTLAGDTVSLDEIVDKWVDKALPLPTEFNFGHLDNESDRSEAKERKRVQNACAAKRSRLRKNLRLQTLEQVVKRLSKVNDCLQSENKILKEENEKLKAENAVKR